MSNPHVAKHLLRLAKQLIKGDVDVSEELDSAYSDSTPYIQLAKSCAAVVKGIDELEKLDSALKDKLEPLLEENAPDAYKWLVQDAKNHHGLQDSVFDLAKYFAQKAKVLHTILEVAKKHV